MAAVQRVEIGPCPSFSCFVALGGFLFFKYSISWLLQFHLWFLRFLEMLELIALEGVV